MAPSRVYIQESIAQTFIDAYISKMKESAAKIGDPQESSVSMGPLVDNRAFDRVKGLVARGKSNATLATGGKSYGDKGCYFEPTVFLNPKPDAEILKEEIFGPVAVVVTFKTEEEALELANDTEFGLMSGVFTRDLNRALRVSAALESGVVGVNCVSYVSDFSQGQNSDFRSTDKIFPGHRSITKSRLAARKRQELDERWANM
jgi:acyl-CoA reductase-like NAD-dependent aldehyde dehydrogenase